MVGRGKGGLPPTFSGTMETAVYAETEEERPNQLFTRWYGFAYTFPGCEVYKE